MHMRPNFEPQPPKRRAKLWELESRFHCLVIGTCLTLEELRRLAHKAGLDTETSDYSCTTIWCSSPENQPQSRAPCISRSSASFMRLLGASARAGTPPRSRCSGARKSHAVRSPAPFGP